MFKKYKYGKLNWVDLESPTYQEIRDVIADYDIEPLVAEELMSPTLRPKVDMYPHSIYLILHFPVFHNSGVKGKKHEIDFILTKNTLITARYSNMEALNNFSKVFEMNTMLQKNELGDHAGYIFFFMIRTIYHALSDELLYIQGKLDDIEDEIFGGKEKEMVQELSVINRELLAFKEAISVHKDVLNSFELAATKFYGKDFDYHLRGIIGEYYKVQSAVDSSKEFLDELRETNDSLLNTKQNEISKILTVTAFIFLPLQVATAIFGMSTNYVPLMNKPSGFWLVLNSMLAIGIVMFIIFKRKKWL